MIARRFIRMIIAPRSHYAKRAESYAAMGIEARSDRHRTGTAGIHREHADNADRRVGLCRSAFLECVLQKQGHDIRLIAARFVKPLKRERTHGLNFEHLFEIDPSIK